MEWLRPAKKVFPSIALTGDRTRNPWTSNLASSSHAKMSEQARLVKQARYDLANILSFVLHFAAFLHIHRVSNAWPGSPMLNHRKNVIRLCAIMKRKLAFLFSTEANNDLWYMNWRSIRSNKLEIQYFNGLVQKNFFHHDFLHLMISQHKS